MIHVVIETAKGSRNKFSFDQDLNVFRLKKVLPEGMSFPYDFGFVPSTRAEDGDPLDVLVLMDEPGRTDETERNRACARGQDQCSSAVFVAAGISRA